MLNHMYDTVGTSLYIDNLLRDFVAARVFVNFSEQIKSDVFYLCTYHPTNETGCKAKKLSYHLQSSVGGMSLYKDSTPTHARVW